MKITQINRDVCKQLRVDMNEAIRSKLEEYGLEGEFLNGSFDDELVTFKVDIKIAGAMDKREKQLSSSLSWYFKHLANSFELDEELNYKKRQVYKSLIDGVTEAIKSDKELIKLCEVKNSGIYITVEKEEWKQSLDSALEYYISTEEYEECSKIKNLIEKL